MATMENGVPSHDTFGRVFRLLDAKRFEQAFRGWIRSVVGAAQEHIAIDGKCVRGGDYVLAVKGNQESLFNALIGCFFGATERERIEQLMPDCTVRTIEKDHGRIEERRYWLVNDMLKRVDCSAWPDCRQIGMVESTRHTGAGEPSVQRRYYITSASCSVHEFARTVREHWHIENTLHWSLDVTFLEDACRVRKDLAAHNFATLRRFAMNLLKLDTSSPKLSVRSRVKRADWDENYRAAILGLKPIHSP